MQELCAKSAVASKKRVSVSCCLETIPTSTYHGSISETLDDILSGQTEFDSRCRIQSDHSKCHQVSLKWSHEMLKSGLFPNSKTQIHASCLRRQSCAGSYKVSGHAECVRKLGDFAKEQSFSINSATYIFSLRNCNRDLTYMYIKHTCHGTTFKRNGYEICLLL